MCPENEDKAEFFNGDQVIFVNTELIQRAVAGLQKSREEFQALLEQADWVTLVSSRYTASCMGQRNLWMVQHSSRMIAVFDGGPGGTANAVDHARRQGISLTVLDPFRPPEANETLSRDFFALHQ